MGGIYSTARLAEVVNGLAERSREAPLRTQLHALAGILANLDAAESEAEVLAGLAQRIEAGIEKGEESEVLRAMAELAALERAPLRRVHWSAASGG